MQQGSLIVPAIVENDNRAGFVDLVNNRRRGAKDPIYNYKIKYNNILVLFYGNPLKCIIIWGPCCAPTSDVKDKTKKEKFLQFTINFNEPQKNIYLDLLCWVELWRERFLKQHNFSTSPNPCKEYLQTFDNYNVYKNENEIKKEFKASLLAFNLIYYCISLLNNGETYKRWLEDAHYSSTTLTTDFQTDTFYKEFGFENEY